MVAVPHQPQGREGIKPVSGTSQPFGGEWTFRSLFVLKWSSGVRGSFHTQRTGLILCHVLAVHSALGSKIQKYPPGCLPTVLLLPCLDPSSCNPNPWKEKKMMWREDSRKNVRPTMSQCRVAKRHIVYNPKTMGKHACLLIHSFFQWILRIHYAPETGTLLLNDPSFLELSKATQKHPFNYLINIDL